MLKPFLHLKLGPLLVLAFLAAQVFGADPAPASPPSSGDPAPASAPMTISTDPSPASPPTSTSTSTTSDPAPASPPGSSNPVPLIDMPTTASMQSGDSGDPAPAGAPGSSQADMLPSVVEFAPTNATVGKAFLGVGFRDPNNTTVTTLWANSTAEKLGIQLGDQVVSINGSPVSNLQQIRTLMGSMAAGDAATVTVTRDQSGPMSVGPMPLGASFE